MASSFGFHRPPKVQLNLDSKASNGRKKIGDGPGAAVEAGAGRTTKDRKAAGTGSARITRTGKKPRGMGGNSRGNFR